MQHKIKFLIILISAVACEVIPKAPERTQYGVYANVKPPGFYGTRSDTKAHVYKAFNDASMKGAQCIDVRDYKAMQTWIDSIKKIANERCR